jgi:outer membrane receptor for ferrienterochelin and colicins
MTKKLLTLCLSILILLSKIILSQEVIELKEIVVTATKLPSKLKNLPYTITIITQEDIKKASLKTLGELLSKKGILVQSYGGFGALQSPSIRAGKADQILFLLDGVRINEPQQGGFDLSCIPLSWVKRIEIIKGPISSHWGQDACSGVINIITKEKTTFSLSAGDKNCRNISGSICKNFPNLKLVLACGYKQADNWRKNAELFYQNDILAKLTHYFKGLSTTLGFNRLDKRKGCPGKINKPKLKDWQKDLQNRYSFKLNYKDFVNLNLFYNDYLRKFWDEEKKELDKHKKYVTSGEIKFSLPINENLSYGFGLDWREDKVDSTKVKIHNRICKSCYLQGLYNSKFIDASVSCRYDKIGKEKAITMNQGFALKLSKDDILKMNWGLGFRAPTFDDLYWPKTAWAEGNPNLKPEKIKEFNISYSKFGHFSICYFKKFADNLIDWFKFPDKIWRPCNINKAEIEGCEFEMNTKLTDWFSISSNYSHYLPIDKEKKEFIKDQLKALFNISYNIDFGQVWANIHTKHVEKYQDIKYKITDLVIGYKDIFTLRINNIFDEEYQDIKGYPGVPRSVFFEINFNPDYSTN